MAAKDYVASAARDSRRVSTGAGGLDISETGMGGGNVCLITGAT